MEITHKNQGELDSTMLPFVMRELVELVMKHFKSLIQKIKNPIVRKQQEYGNYS